MAKEPMIHVCGPSDHIASVARTYGFFNWETLWKLNDSLGRENPNMLLEGDAVNTGPKEQKKYTCDVDAEYTWKVPTYKLFLNVKVLLPDMSPVKNATYEVDFDASVTGLKVETAADGTTKRYSVDGTLLPLTGKTGKDGSVKFRIPPQLETATLTVRVPAGDTDSGGKKSKKAGVAGDVPVAWTLRIGRLCPLQEDMTDDECSVGAQQRLANIKLGGNIETGELPAATLAAFGEFCRVFGLKEKAEGGKIPAEMRKKLVQVHDAASAPPKPTA